jgi:hypothetical protein
MIKPNITPGPWTWQGTGQTKKKILPRLTHLQSFDGKGLAKTVLVIEGEVWRNQPDAVAIAAVPHLLETLEKIASGESQSPWSEAKVALIKAGYEITTKHAPTP